MVYRILRAGITIFFFQLSFLNIQAQQEKETDLSGFLTGTLTYNSSKKWFGYIELQARSIERFNTIDYYELKGGPGYKFNDNHQVLVGFGRYGTYKSNSLNQEEFRTWLQYIFSNTWGRVEFDHRVRAEQRFFYHTPERRHSNTQRYRYRLTTTVPINHKEVKPKTVFLNAFEEVFFGPKENAFKRNRLFAGLGYQFTDEFGLTGGYLWQREFAPDGNENIHFIQVTFNVSLDNKDLTNNKRRYIRYAD